MKNDDIALSWWIVVCYKQMGIARTECKSKFKNSGVFFLFLLLILKMLWRKKMEKVHFRSQILKHPSIGEYWNIFGVLELLENMIFMFFRKC